MFAKKVEDLVVEPYQRQKESTMQAIVDGHLASLSVGEGKVFGGMHLFPVSRSGESPLRYRVLLDALADGSVEVRERPSASVPELWLVNRSADMVFVMDGEEIVGGKQNRMVNASFLIAPRSEVMLPVTCVEHGRWHDVAPRFTPGEAAPAFLRREKETQVRENLRVSHRHVADQSAVWDAIAHRQREERVQSPTGAMNDLYRGKEKSLGDYEQAFQVVEDALGMVVALNGRMVGADLFDQASTAGRLWTKLVRSYAMDAVAGAQDRPVDRERAEKLLKRVVDARSEAYPSIGLGHDVRLEGTGATASGLIYEGIVVHLAVFRVHGQRSAGETGGIARASLRRRMQRGPAD